MVDVNMAITRNNVIEEYVFKDIKPIKKKLAHKQEGEQRLQQTFVKTIQEMQTKDPPKKLIPKEKT